MTKVLFLSLVLTNLTFAGTMTNPKINTGKGGKSTFGKGGNGGNVYNNTINTYHTTKSNKTDKSKSTSFNATLNSIKKFLINIY